MEGNTVTQRNRVFRLEPHGCKGRFTGGLNFYTECFPVPALAENPVPALAEKRVEEQPPIYSIQVYPMCVNG